MTLRSNLLPVINKARAFIESRGLRTCTLAIVTRTWTGKRSAESLYSDAVVQITPSPRVREISTQEVASTGGLYEQGDVRADKITPAFTALSGSGGYTADQLNAAGDEQTEVFFRITGAITGDFRRVQTVLTRNFGYTIVLRRLNRTP